MFKNRKINGRGFVGVKQIDRKTGYGRPHDLEGHKTSRLALNVVYQN